MQWFIEKEGMALGKNILTIYCPNCGRLHVHQAYLCQYCGGKVSIETAKREKDLLFKKRDDQERPDYDLETTSCSGCGATIVFEKSESLSRCEFCGRNLIRKRYAMDSELPQYVIPFGLTRDEAAERLSQWCDQNSGKPEAKHLKTKISTLRGYYLPYKMVQGPVHCTVNKRSGATAFKASGYLKGEFIKLSQAIE